MNDDTALAVLTELRRIAAGIEGLRADLRRREAAPPPADRLLIAAERAFGESAWVTAQLMARALDSDDIGTEVAAAIAATGKTSTRALGKFLARIAGADCGELVLRRLDARDAAGELWMLARVSNAQTHAGA